MEKINSKDYYPFFTSDFFIEIEDEIALALKRFDLNESAYQLRTYRHNDTSAQPQPCTSRITQWGRLAENLEEVQFL